MNRTSRQFPLIDISGEPFNRGRTYGAKCAARIRETVHFYRTLFPQPPRALVERASAYRAAIRRAAPEIAEEIRGISEGSGAPETDIVLLNARSELLGGMECTSLSFPGAKVMGQTWDWAERLESLAILLRIDKPDGSGILMLVEPGMVGKIGMNSSGVGVCINFLESATPLAPGVPFHVLARLALEERSCGDAASRVERHGGYAVGHLLIGDATGRGASIELTGGNVSAIRGTDAFMHTNHCLRLPGKTGMLDRFDSTRRLTRMAHLARDADRSAKGVQRILTDRSGLFPISRRYPPSFGKRGTGTVATIAMDLAAGAFLVKKGPDPDADFHRVLL